MSKNGSLIASEILIVDDEEDIRDLISGILADEGYATRTAGDSESALAALRQRRPQLVVLDIWLQGSRLDGIEVLDAIKREHPDLPVVMISGHGTIETAVASIKKGAYDFIEKPFNADRLLHVAERALEAARLKREVRELKLKTGDEGEMVGQSTIVSQLRMLIEKIAPTNSRVLIAGPAGSGKEVAARMIHARSRRAGNAFVAINCATMAPENLESELFGVESGDGRKTGLFELAHNGTLYLDEVADMSLETQGKILRVLIDQTFTRVGGTTRVQVDARVICSTTRDLRAETEAGRFREDLYHRLNVVPVRVPSLAERRDDIPVLVAHFMKRLSAAAGLPARPIGESAMAVLQTHGWPGNVRQLRNIVERLLILASDDVADAITADLIPADLGGGGLGAGKGGDMVISLPLREAREIFERDYLVAQINRFGGNISRTAAFIGMERSALHRKLKSLGVGATQGVPN
jgi:two-component system nitrogen regulation response regulator NtrX